MRRSILKGAVLMGIAVVAVGAHVGGSHHWHPDTDVALMSQSVAEDDSTVTDTGFVAGTTYYHLTTGWADTLTFDRTGEWNAAAGDELCYTGTRSPVDIFINVAMSFAGADIAASRLFTFTLAKDTTGNFSAASTLLGQPMPRSVTSSAVWGMGALAAHTTVSTNDCIAILVQVDVTTADPKIDAFDSTILIAEQ